MNSPSAPALVTHAYTYDNASRVASFNTTGSGATTRGYGYDPTGLTQAGNPLTNLFAGGFSGGSVAKDKVVNPYVASGGNKLSLGTLGSVLGNSVYNAGAAYLSSSTIGAIGAGINYATIDSTPSGTYGPFPKTLTPQVVADLRNQGRVTEPARDVLSIRYTDSLGNDKKALVERHVSGLGKAPAGQVRTTYDIINSAPIYVTDYNLAEIVLNNRKIRSLESVVGAANLGTAITPYVSDARDVIEFRTGRDAITHEPLTPTGRFLTGVGLALPIVGGVLFRKAFGATGEVYDVGRVSDLRNTSIPFTEVHHAPQIREAESLVGSYRTANRAGSEIGIRLPISEHEAVNAAQRIRTAAASARDLLADEIRILRNNTIAPYEKLKQLINSNTSLHPSDFAPLHRSNP